MEEICKHFMLGTSGTTNLEEMTKKISVQKIIMLNSLTKTWH